MQVLLSARSKLLSSADLLSSLSGVTHEQRSSVGKHKHWLSVHVALALLCFCPPLPLVIYEYYMTSHIRKVVLSVLAAVVASVSTDSIIALGDSSVSGFGVSAVGRVCWMGLLWFVYVTLCFVKQLIPARAECCCPTGDVGSNVAVLPLLAQRKNLYTGRRMTTILCTSLGKNNRVLVTGDNERAAATPLSPHTAQPRGSPGTVTRP